MNKQSGKYKEFREGDGSRYSDRGKSDFLTEEIAPYSRT
jgi:hypothetical protein